ncbi:hypothetical protein V5O48_007670 [Marasmius crinis-equi]|uniref:DUF4220 domain-containing protein n=1 Tax=Marasmius crinis-equi TaxID=585013 RepID=A0ABR3FG43_9AGAR
MAIAILTPEAIMLWAMRQRHTAKVIAREFERHGWTKTHGFLCIMQGLALYDRDEFLGYIQYSQYPDSIEQRETERLLKKVQDVLHEANASPYTADLGFGPQVAQTSSSSPVDGTGSPSPYTAALCIENHLTPPIVPKAAHLTRPRPSYFPVYQSEATFSCSGMTLAGSRQNLLGGQDLRTKNALLYYLLERGLLKIPESDIKGTLDHGEFFAKVVALGQTIWFIAKVVCRLRQNLFVTELEVITLGFTCLTFMAYGCWFCKPQRVRFPYRVVIRKQSPELHALQSFPLSFYEPYDARKASAPKNWIERTMGDLKDCAKRASRGLSRLGKRIRRDYNHIFGNPGRHHSERRTVALFLRVFRVLAYPILYLGKQIIAILNADGARKLVPDYLFFCGLRADRTPLHIYIIIYCILGCSGTLHFIRWTSPAPSIGEIEQSWWRASAVMVTALPLILALTHSQLQVTRPRESWSFKKVATLIVYALVICTYIVARYILVFLAVTELWHLPHDAYREVEI